jgi:hypothetical protein
MRYNEIIMTNQVESYQYDSNLVSTKWSQERRDYPFLGRWLVDKQVTLRSATAVWTSVESPKEEKALSCKARGD